MKTALRKLRRSWREAGLVVLGYFLVAVYATWPLAIRPLDGFYGFGNDNWGGIWFLGWLNRAYFGPESASFTPELQAPFGFEIPAQIIHPYTHLMAFLFGGFEEGLGAYNFPIFSSFVLAGVTMYLLVKELTANRGAAFVAGLIYTYSPYHLAEAMQYDLLASIQWIPLFLLFLLRLFRSGKVRDGIATGVAFFLVTATNYYYGWFVLWSVPFLLVGYVLAARLGRREATTTRPPVRQLMKAGLVGAAVSLLLIVPTTLPSLLTTRQGSGISTAHPITEAIRYSARPWMLFVPPHDNPLVPEDLTGWIQAHLFEMANYEQAIYLGYTALVLASIGVIAATRAGGIRNVMAWVLVAGMVGGLVMMIGPYIPLERTYWRYWSDPARTSHVPSLGLLMFKLGPMFRFFVRAFVVVSACLAALAGLGFAHLAAKVRPSLGRGLLLTAVVVMIGLEFSNAPPRRWYDASPPAWVRAVQKLPEDAEIVEYPLSAVNNPRSLYYLFWQKEHGRPTVNPANTPGSLEFSARVSDPNSPASGEQLAEAGIDFAVIHTNLPPPTFPPYQPELPDDSLDPKAGSGNPWFEFHSRTKDAVIYRIRRLKQT